ncbi:MAG: transposase, partial [Phycisphaerae bacterium]
FHRQYPLEGYRRLAFMMLDRDVVAASPSSVYRVLRDAGLLRKWNRNVSHLGTYDDLFAYTVLDASVATLASVTDRPSWVCTPPSNLFQITGKIKKGYLLRSAE